MSSSLGENMGLDWGAHSCRLAVKNYYESKASTAIQIASRFFICIIIKALEALL